jgi:DNA mismatch endonuclease (patch repair protein)
MELLLRKKLPGGGFASVSKERSDQMRAVRGRGNKSTEVCLRLALAKAGVRGWRIVARSVCGCPDFYFPKEQLAVFVDGCFWHGCPRCGHIPQTNRPFWRTKIMLNRLRDRATTARLRRQGIAVVRFWEHELQSDLRRCVDQLRAQLVKRKEIARSHETPKRQHSA